VNKLLGFTENDIVNKKMENTIHEIARQPNVWKAIYDKVLVRKNEIKNFMAKIDQSSRIIFTGAGSSGFVGDSLAPVIRKELGYHHIESIHTTDIVAKPKQYLVEDAKTLLISFGRSGDSPESIAAIEIAEKNIKNVFHIIITCSSQGKLASFQNERTLNFVFDEAGDKGFAMTSSVTGMMLAAYSILNIAKDVSDDVARIAAYTEELIHTKYSILFDSYKKDVERLVVLGAGNLLGAAKEAALKMLELTAGKIISRYDTPMGFRHGPKAMLTPKTTILYFVSNNEYTQKYDLDMLKELSQAVKYKLIAVSDNYDADIEKYADVYLFNSTRETLEEAFTPYVPLVIAQLYALFASTQLNCTPDNPFPSGEVNKIVQGVSIYKS
jgi:tagatose-6-phosphate ketose/aldose isomerase